MNRYDDVLLRMKEYKKKAGFTQEKMGSILGVKQEQYCYIQKGIFKLSDRHLMALHNLGWSVDYLITGQDFANDFQNVEEIFAGFESRQKSIAMKFLAELLLQRVAGYEKEPVVMEKQKYLDMLAAMLEEWDHFSMMKFVRNRLGLTQIDMATKIGVGIKKYRALEREKRYPDAEMLMQLYELSGYQPSLFLNLTDRRQVVFNYIFGKLKKEDRNIVIRLMYYTKMLL